MAEFSTLERALENEIDYFISMSDAELVSHITNSRIKQRVSSIGKYGVHIYSRDHNPPHFHVISKDGSLDAKFRIDDGSLLSQRGDLRSGVLMRMDLWHKDIKTQTVIKAIWNKRNS